MKHMKKFDDGTKVWIVEETTFPYNIVEGIIRQYRPQRLEGLELKYYSVYFEVDDKEYLCEEGQLFTDREHAAEDRKETIQTYIKYMTAELEEYLQQDADVESINTDIDGLKHDIAELKKLLKID